MTGGDLEVAMVEARKVPATEAEVQKALADAMRGILGSGVARTALQNPSAMTYNDIVRDRHLYERLGIAFAALGALRGYYDQPRGYRLEKP